MALFLHLGNPAIDLWDESRLAVNAYEMLQNGNFLVTYYDGQPDVWNCKPPFLIWLQAICMSFLGPNETALRLPSAFAALGVVFLLLWFSKKTTQNYRLGVCAALALVLSNGYVVQNHVVRAGDYDSMLTFWVIFYSFHLFLFLENHNSKHLHWAGFGVLLAILTKSIAALLFMPGLFLYLLFTRKALILFKSKVLYIWILIILLVVSSYYLGREQYNPGYLKAVWHEEVVGRYTQMNTNEPFSYYWFRIADRNFLPFIYFIFIGIVLFSNKLSNLNKRVFAFTLIISVSFLVILSFNVCKKEWYDLPVYPILALMASVVFFMPLYKEIKSRIYDWRIPTFLLFCILFFTGNTIFVFSKVYLPKKSEYPPVQYEFLMRKMDKTLPEIKRYYLWDTDYNACQLFYQKTRNNHKGFQIERKNTEYPFQKNDIVLVCSPSNLKRFEDKFEVEVIESELSCKTYRVLSTKAAE